MYGFPMKPRTARRSVVSSTGIIAANWRSPNRSIIRCSTVAGFTSKIVSSSLMNVMATSGLPSAMRCTASYTCRNSVDMVLRNFLRAGTLKKRFCTDTDVPGSRPSRDSRGTLPPSIRTTTAISSAALRVFIVTWATEAMEASASPRKPYVRISSSSSYEAILLVA